jgi:hypothetical protein
VKWTVGLAIVIVALAANTGLTQQAPSSQPPAGPYVVSAHAAQNQGYSIAWVVGPNGAIWVCAANVGLEVTCRQSSLPWSGK